MYSLIDHGSTKHCEIIFLLFVILKERKEIMITIEGGIVPWKIVQTEFTRISRKSKGNSVKLGRSYEIAFVLYIGSSGRGIALIKRSNYPGKILSEISVINFGW